MGGSNKHPLMFLCLGRMLGGSEAWGNTGSIRGCRDSKGDRWEVRGGTTELTVGRVEASLGGIGGGGEASLGGRGGVSPATYLGLGGRGGGLPIGIGARLLLGMELEGHWGRTTVTLMGSFSRRLLSLSRGLV